MEYRQALAAGTLLASEYRISSTLRQDGFCITYDAEDLQLKSHVLIKEYFPAEIADRFNLVTVRPKSTRQVGVLSWGRQRFIEEAQTLTKFGHSGIARVKRVFEENNTAYAVIDAEDWPTLLSWADKQRRQLNQNELDQVAKQLLDSLDLLHDANVLVRDLSPESIYIRDKRHLVLVDFGTAKAQLAARARKMHAVVRPGYSAPEQYLFDDEQQGPWTDIFSLGAVLYRLFTGRSPVEVIHRHHTDDMAKAASLHTKGYRLEFLQAIDKAMSLSASDRPQTAKAFRALLMEAPKGAGPAKAAESPPATPPQPPAETSRPAASPPAPTQSDLATASTPVRQSEPTIVAPPRRPQPASGPSVPAGGAASSTEAAAPTVPPTASAAAATAAPDRSAAPQASSSTGAAASGPAGSSGSAKPAAPAPSAPRIPAGMVPSALLSDRAAEEDKLGFRLPEAEPEPEPAKETPKDAAAAKKGSDKESPVKSDPARGNEIDALAVSNRRFMIAVVGIIGALIGIIGLGLLTLERTLRQPSQQQAQAEHAQPPAPARTEQERQRAEQKALFEDGERKRREAEQAAEQRRAAEAGQKRRDEEAARQRRAQEAAAEQKRRDEEAAKQKQIADAAEKKRVEEAAADRKRKEDEAAEQKRKAAEAAKQKQVADAAEKKRAEEAERKRTEEAARQKAIEEAADKKRRDEEIAREKLAAEEAAAAKSRGEEAAQKKRQADAEAERKRLADAEAEKKRPDSAEQRRLAEEAARQKQLADEVDRRRQEEAARAELKRLAEEAEKRRREQAQKDAVDRQQSDKLRQAEEAQRIAERQRAEADRQLLAQVTAESSREQLLKIASLNPERRELVERRLVELGYQRVAATAGELWRKPGGGEAFQDCPTCPALVVVPAGQFLMGSPPNEANRQDDEDDTPGPGGSQVRVAIPKPFAITKLEITRGQFAAFVAETKHKIERGCFVRVDAFELFPDFSWQSPGFKQTDEHPVACVSWLDAKAYAAWLSKKTGRTYRLLTEAEWEYAARGAPGPTVQPRFPFGTSDKDLCAFGNGADQAAKKVYERWQVAGCNDGFDHTAPAGSFEPNATGVHDMLGNLWEWVEDCYRDSLRGQPRKADQTEACSQELRVLRGGSWSDPPDKLRPAARIAIPADKRIQIGGFRLARDL